MRAAKEIRIFQLAKSFIARQRGALRQSFQRRQKVRRFVNLLRVCFGERFRRFPFTVVTRGSFYKRLRAR